MGVTGREGLGRLGVGATAWERLPDSPLGSHGSTPTVTSRVDPGSCVHGHDRGLPQAPSPGRDPVVSFQGIGPHPTSGGTQPRGRGDAPVAACSPGNLAGNLGEQIYDSCHLGRPRSAFPGCLR